LNIYVCYSPLSQYNIVRASLELFNFLLALTKELVICELGRERIIALVEVVGRERKNVINCVLWGRVYNRKASALGGTTILAKLQVSDEGQVKSENLYIQYTQIHVMVIAFRDVSMLNLIRVRSLSRCYKNNPINMASFIDHRLKLLRLVQTFLLVHFGFVSSENYMSKSKKYNKGLSHGGVLENVAFTFMYILHYI